MPILEFRLVTVLTSAAMRHNVAQAMRATPVVLLLDIKEQD